MFSTTKSIGGDASSMPVDASIARRLEQTLPKMGPCSDTCRYILPRLEIHVSGSQWFLASPFNPVGTSLTFRRRIKSVFICPHHFNVHFCSPACSKHLNEDRCLACTLTGVVWDEEVEVTRSWRTSSRTEAAQTADKTDPMRHNRDKIGRLGDAFQHNVRDAGRLKLALQTLDHMFFSKTRIAHELEADRLAKKQGMKKVTRYARQCMRDKKFRNVAEMQRLFSTECSARGRYLHRIHAFKKDTQFLHALAEDATKIFRRLKERGLSVAKFEHFVVAIVYLMRRGLKCGVPRRPSLDLLLPPANCLTRFFGPDLNFTQTKNAITKILRN